MKKISKILLLVTLTFVYLGVSAQDKIISFSDLPKTAKTFISKYYNEDQVAYIVMDKELFSTSYEVKLHNGVEVEFDGKGNWTEIDADTLPVPNGIVPVKIRNYINKSFPNNEIVKISKSKNKFELELKNGLDLEFNNKGEFIRIDD